MTGDVLATVAMRERSAPDAPTLDVRPDDDMPSLESNFWLEEPRWSRPWRIVFTLVAAAVCWAVPIAAVYWLAS